MISRIINPLAYTGIIVAMLATCIAIFTFLFLNKEPNYILLVLICSGTLVIYNLDHLKDIKSDKTTNPGRVNFIEKNRVLIYCILAFSLIMSALSVYYLGIHLIPLIFLPFLLGIIHRIIKNSPLFTAVYITLSWLMITVYLPAYVTATPGKVIMFSIVTGILLFCNAYTSSVRQQTNAKKVAAYMVYFSFLSLLILLLLRGTYMAILPASLLTTIALIYYYDDEKYELLILDGMQLFGIALSILILLLIRI